MVKEMGISEAARTELYNAFVRTLGANNAETVMSVLPFYELDEVANKGDIRLLKGDISLLRSELKAEIELVNVRLDNLEQRFDGLERGLEDLRRAGPRWAFGTVSVILAAMAAFQLAG